MTEQWAIALVIFVLGQALVVIGGGIGAYVMLLGKISGIEIEAEHRLTELETKCERWFVLTGAQGLHKDDDRFHTDAELESFVTDYKKHNHDLPDEEWRRYRSVFERIMNSKLATTNEKALAEGLKELCEHKLSRSQI